MPGLARTGSLVVLDLVLPPLLLYPACQEFWGGTRYWVPGTRWKPRSLRKTKVWTLQHPCKAEDERFLFSGALAVVSSALGFIGDLEFDQRELGAVGGLVLKGVRCADGAGAFVYPGLQNFDDGVAYHAGGETCGKNDEHEFLTGALTGFGDRCVGNLYRLLEFLCQFLFKGEIELTVGEVFPEFRVNIKLQGVTIFCHSHLPPFFGACCKATNANIRSARFWPLAE